MSKDNKYYSYGTRIKQKVAIVAILIFISLTLGAFLSFRDNSLTVLNYKERSDVNYTIHLKENDYYETDTLPKGGQYIANLIDKINVDFVYHFMMNQEVDLNYSYRIVADIIVEDQADGVNNVIFERTIPINEPVSLEKYNERGFSIIENVTIDYSEYNELINSFELDFNLNATSRLVLKLYVDTEAEYTNFEEPISTNNVIELTIPLTERIINIGLNYNQINTSVDHYERPDYDLLNLIILGIAVLTTLIALYKLIELAYFIIKSRPKHSKYQKKIKKLLREYDRTIVETKTVINITDEMEVFEITKFEELLDVSDRLELPILFMEIHQEKSWFVVRNGNEVFRMIMKAVDIE